ncbi:uncharacterized protein LOC126367564 [Pectinophora gossypiella]|uniref:uncharacterized protein LOC126367564 n=1 Tax=Pectinophora gossypiella TaxID=13191 RepID=UPI00214ECB63|nr:uncharacterized protein LOC126367564 [Pectinophora gossypiella]
MRESEGEAEGASSEWGSDSGRAAEVLRLVLCWLDGRSLSRAGAVCRAWRRAAAAPAAWRRLLGASRAAPHAALRALQVRLARAHADGEDSDLSDDDDDIDAEWSWRDEYVRAVAGWRLVRVMRPCDGEPAPAAGGTSGGGAAAGDRGPAGATAGEPHHTAAPPEAPTLLHAALTDAGDALVTCADDATVTVWVRANEAATMWRPTWRAGLRRRGWRAVARGQWAPGAGGGGGDGAGGRLLLAGPLLLSDRWELCVLQLEAGYGSATVLARAGCSAGAAGCWAGRGAFLSLELRLLAPRRAVTTVWLNAATQEAQSEFAGVATPVLRVYNEAQTHLSHVIVVEVPEDGRASAEGDAEAQYLRAWRGRAAGGGAGRVLVAGCGLEGGGAGLAGWRLAARHVPPLCAAAAGGLAERVARRRHAAARPPRASPPPAEAELRALCEAPAARCELAARVVGLAPHARGRCVWALDAAGRATCAALPGLRALRVLQPRAPPPAAHAHYVQPAVSQDFLVSPVGGYSGRLSVWSARSGARCEPPAPAPAPAAAVLLPRPRTLLLLAGNLVQAVPV